MSGSFLDKAYTARTAAGTRDLYDAWAVSYEAELTRNGYVTPARCAAALAAHLPDRAAPVLDFGCGTGLSGQALHAEGFRCIDGVDLSADMLARARDKGVYRTLTQVEPDAPLAHRAGDYAAVTAVGVIGVGAAPLSTIDALMARLAPGGLFVLSFNDKALANPAHEARLMATVEAGLAEMAFREHGPHIPGIGIGATVYVLKRL